MASIVRRAPRRRRSDNGSSCVAADLADYLTFKAIDNLRGAPHHPQTQGKIERWPQTMNNRVQLENHLLPGEPQRQIGAFVDRLKNYRNHESLGNLTPADDYYGSGADILNVRAETKKKTIIKRRLQHQATAA